MPKIILASSSPYRKALLQRLLADFSTTSPATDETPAENESPESLVLRLARDKATSVADQYPACLIIGSDQVACQGTEILTKPGNRENAFKQLARMRGKTVRFLTGLCLYNSGSHHYQSECVSFDVSFRDYLDDEIERYLEREAPYDCAGSFKSEKLGISLVDRMSGDDPTALVGLPLIRLARMLRKEGLQIP